MDPGLIMFAAVGAAVIKLKPAALILPEILTGGSHHMNFQKLTMLALAATTGAGISLQAGAADITGAGATFPYPIYAKWADAYKKPRPASD